MPRRSDAPKIDPKIPRRGTTKSDESLTAPDGKHSPHRGKRDARRLATEPARDDPRAPESARREDSGL